MSSHFDLYALKDPRHICLKIEPEVIMQAWEKSQICSTPWAKWNAYLDRVCLDTFVPWLKEECGWQGKVYPHPQAIRSLSELVQGIAVDVNDLRLVLIPSETLDFKTIYVHQEWVDIPEWIGDYYMAIALECEEGWMQILGYTTHQTIKQQGVYDAGDRQYCIHAKDIVQDLNVLWLSGKFCPQEETRTPVPTISTLATAQAHNLLKRLGNPNIILPRLNIPFALWAGLLVHDGWRQQLSETRQGLTCQWSVADWLQSQISEIGHAVGWRAVNLLQAPVGVKGNESEVTVRMLSRQLIIAGLAYELRVFSKEQTEERLWCFELRSAEPGKLVPGGFQLKLLTEDLQPFPNNITMAATAIEALSLEVALEPGEGLVWETSPLPENYLKEVLYF
jgi:hypothetical protein